MTLLARTTARRRRGMAIENVIRSECAERRVDEIGAVTDIERDYHAVDRAGDLAIESKFSELYQLVDTEDEKRAVATAFSIWQRSERQEDVAVTGAVGDAARTSCARTTTSGSVRPSRADRTGQRR